MVVQRGRHWLGCHIFSQVNTNILGYVSSIVRPSMNINNDNVNQKIINSDVIISENYQMKLSLGLLFRKLIDISRLYLMFVSLSVILFVFLHVTRSIGAIVIAFFSLSAAYARPACNQNQVYSSSMGQCIPKAAMCSANQVYSSSMHQCIPKNA